MLAVAASAHAPAASPKAEVTLSHELPTAPLPTPPVVVGDSWQNRRLRFSLRLGDAWHLHLREQEVAAIDTTSCRTSGWFGVPLLCQRPHPIRWVPRYSLSGPKSASSRCPPNMDVGPSLYDNRTDPSSPSDARSN